MRKWTALWFFLVSALSLAPLSVKKFLRSMGPLHNYGHFLVFFTSGILLLSTAAPSVWFVRMLLLLLFCATIEGLQTVFYTHHFEWSDLFVDYFAVAISFSCFVLHTLLTRKLSAKSELGATKPE
jgi:hypothetical protein